MKPEIYQLIDWYRDSRNYANPQQKIPYPKEEIIAGALEILKISETPDFTGQSCSNLIMMLKNYRLRWMELGRELQQHLQQAVARSAASFNAQNIANTLNALGNMGLDWPGLDRGLGQHLQRR